MRALMFGTVVSLAVWSATGAFALPATPEGAARISSALATYLGPAADAVTVTPRGEVYDLTLDASALVQGLLPTGGSFTMTPYAMVLTDLGEGRWQIDETGSLAVALKIPNVIEMAFTIDKITGQSIFSETLMAAESANYELTGMHTSQTTFAEPGGPAVSKTDTASYTISSTAVAGANGGVDVTYTSDSSTTLQEQDMALMPGSPPMHFTVAMASQHVDSTITGLRTAELYALVAWAVSQSSVDVAKSRQSEAKTLIKALLPVFDNMNGTGSVNGIKVGTPVGEFALSTASFVVDLNGIVSAARLAETVTLTGLSVPQDVLPPWANGLVPESFSFDFALSDFDLAAPLATVIETFDVNAPEPLPDTMMFPLLGQLLPNGALTFQINDLSAQSRLYTLKSSGEMKLGMMGVPGTGKIEVTGLDAVIAALQAGPPDETGELAAGLGMAQGLAKPGTNGGLLWELELSPTGGLSVNGTQLTP